MPSVDFSDLEAGRSEIRNKVLAPVFKRLGIIEQRGNGLKLISEELLQYLNIKMQWKDIGIAFRVKFTNLAYAERLLKQTDGEVTTKTVGKLWEKLWGRKILTV